MAEPTKEDIAPEEVDDEGPAVSVADSSDSGEGGKLKMIVQLLKKCLGVKDIASMRLSLPASLLEPLPNLEYWHYLDRPDIFASVNDFEDPFERMVAVVRFAFTKDLKYVHGKVCKPYNSVLGEHFRSHWDVPPLEHSEDPMAPPVIRLNTTASLDASSVLGSSAASTSKRNSVVPKTQGQSDSTSLKSTKSEKSSQSGLSLVSSGKSGASTSTGETSLENGVANLNLGNSNANSIDTQATSQKGVINGKLRVIYLTEQVSHHPPVSAYYATCPAKHLSLAGIDQIMAKVSGTTLRVGPGSYNKGIFLKIEGGYGAGETYHLSHPVASVNGLLRGSFYITVGDTTIITCKSPKGWGDKNEMLRAVIEYKEESWLGKAHFLVEGVIHTYIEGERQHEEWTKVKHVPKERVLAVLDGCWREHIRWKKTASWPPSSAVNASSASSTSSGSSKSTVSNSKQIKCSEKNKSDSASTEYATLVDLSSLRPVPKSVRPLEKQLPTESRKLWEHVTNNLLAKEYNEATKHKLAIEQRQRDEAAERKKKGTKFIPRYFEEDIDSGIPTLTAEGWKAIEEELQEDSEYCIEDAGRPSLTSA